MSTFVQLHTLTAYGPSNLNRDEAGRPKSAMLGGVPRLRVSSQCHKRAWRKSEVFEKTVGDHIGLRTRRLGAEVRKHLASTIDDKTKIDAAVKALTDLWKSKESAAGGRGKDVLFLFSRGEWKSALEAAEKLATGQIEAITHDDILAPEDQDVDVAMFGRMLAAAPLYNVTAACQVSHAITTHRAVSEDDYFSACDDFGDVAGDQGAGAGHIDVREFGSGIFYSYICIDRDLLLSNLRNRTDLANAAIDGLIRAALTVSPGGMQASFGSRALASYALVETGSQQPRSLVGAFVRPVGARGENDYLGGSVAALEKHRSLLSKVYGQSWSAEAALDVTGDAHRGSIDALIDVARAAA